MGTWSLWDLWRAAHRPREGAPVRRRAHTASDPEVEIELFGSALQRGLSLPPSHGVVNKRTVAKLGLGHPRL